jgi:hypothetical protein
MSDVPDRMTMLLRLIERLFCLLTGHYWCSIVEHPDGTKWQACVLCDAERQLNKRS